MPHNLLSTSDLKKTEILALFKRADGLRRQKQIANNVNLSKTGALLFFEPSTRTRIGFEIAAWRLGVKSVSMEEAKLTKAMGRSESMRDTIRTLNPYVDYFCVRHPNESVFNEIIPFTEHPVINCGNGYLEHPTQALIDAYTMWVRFGRLDGLRITIIGQLKYDRSAHSLLLLLSKFSNITVNEVAPTKLQAQGYLRKAFAVNNTYRQTDPDWTEEQVVYVTGFQRKNPSGVFSQKLRDKYAIDGALAKQLPEDCIILNALPRIHEIKEEVDTLPQAYYFKQNELGLFMRIAVLEKYCLL